MPSLIHPTADVQSSHIGEGTRIWQFCVVLPGARIGRGCNICSHCFVENDVVVGDEVTIKNGVQLWDGLRIEDGAFVGPNVTFTNDPFPRSKRRPQRFLATVVERGASIGAGATILPGLTLGAACMVGAGAVVTRSVPPGAIVAGNPARIVGYIGAAQPSPVEPRRVAPPAERPATQSSIVGGVSLHFLPEASDMRGRLSVVEFQRFTPFAPRRLFMVYGVPSRETRGGHAHRECHQFLICVSGSCSVMVDDGSAREEFRLSSPSVALHVPPMIWAAQHDYTADAVVAVLASHAYDPADYIRDYEEFRGARAPATR